MELPNTKVFFRNRYLTRKRKYEFFINFINGKDSEKDCYPNETSLLENAPLAVYESQTSGGVYSPVDDVTTNYIVISGKIGLTPLSQMTANFKEVMEQDTYDHWHKTVPSRTNGDGRYYTQKYWCAELPTDVAE